jgi:hypothetical protein
VSIQQDAKFDAVCSGSGAVFSDRASSLSASVDCDGRRLLDVENKRFLADNMGSDARCSDSGSCRGIAGTGTRCCWNERCLRGTLSGAGSGNGALLEDIDCPRLRDWCDTDFFSVRRVVSGSQPLSTGFGGSSYACCLPLVRGLMGLNSAENVRLEVEAEPAE